MQVICFRLFALKSIKLLTNVPEDILTHILGLSRLKVNRPRQYGTTHRLYFDFFEEIVLEQISAVFDCKLQSVLRIIATKVN
jgi:hypothetical protein